MSFVLLKEIPVEAAEDDQIHFVSLDGNTDAIVIESNGHYGMVDSGEDWDYPSGENSKYPLRPGITKTIGYDQQVIHYLEKLGVQQLDFYIATHAHSDHIGTADEVIRRFPTKKLYISEYRDEFLVNTSLFDNQYVYDQLMEVAKETNVEIITGLDNEDNKCNRSFEMGDLKIYIMNYERERDDNGNIIPTESCNDDSFVVRVEGFGKNVLLTSDMDPINGDSVKIAEQLVDQLYDTNAYYDQIVEEQVEKMPDYSYQPSVETVMEIPKNIEDYDRIEGNTSIDESKINDGKRISIDLLKLAHHGLDYNNTTYFLTTVNPKQVVVTGNEDHVSDRQRKCFPEAPVYTTISDSAAIIATFFPEQLKTVYAKLTPHWELMKGIWYYFDSNGRPSTGAKMIGGKVYCFNEKGEMQKGTYYIDGCFYFLDSSGAAYNKLGWWYKDGHWYHGNSKGGVDTGWKYIQKKWYYFNQFGIMKTGWQYIDGKWYYLDGSGAMKTGWQYVSKTWYYLDGSGAMLTGWQYLDGRWYYLDGSGAMQSGWKFIGGKWYYLNKSGAMLTGWQYLDGKWYYLDGSGVMQTGTSRINGLIYCFSDSGAMLTGWQFLNGNWYYLNGSGAASIGWSLQNGIWYYLNENGTMQTGFSKIQGKTYYFASNGAMQTGWKKINNNWYYFASSGAQLIDWQIIAGTWYYFDSSGVMQIGWVKIKDQWYYFAASGAWNPTPSEEQPAEPNVEDYYAISGESSYTVEQLIKFYQDSGAKYPKEALEKGGSSTIESFCNMYYEECLAEGIKVEVAFAQAMVETGYLQFGGDVKIDQYNFAGIGAVGNGAVGASFNNVREGIRAQVQHLKCYANKEPLVNECVDPRWGNWIRGSAPYIEWLSIPNNPEGKGWATDPNYAKKILDIIRII